MHKKPTSNRSASSRPAARTATTTTEATSAEVRQALESGTARLGAAEERALRMRFGVGAPHTLVLERVGQDNPDSREKLLGIELELMRQWRERQATTHRPDPRSQAVQAPAAKAGAPENPRRAKIVQALQGKKTSK